QGSAAAAEQELLIHLDQSPDLLQLVRYEIALRPIGALAEAATGSVFFQLPLLALEPVAALLVELRRPPDRRLQQRRGKNEAEGASRHRVPNRPSAAVPSGLGSKPFLPSRSSTAGRNDAKKIAGFEARAADQRTVDVVHPHEGTRVVGLYRS